MGGKAAGETPPYFAKLSFCAERSASSCAKSQDRRLGWNEVKSQLEPYLKRCAKNAGITLRFIPAYEAAVARAAPQGNACAARRRMAFLGRAFFIVPEMVPLVGLELTTYRLQGGCSTN